MTMLTKALAYAKKLRPKHVRKALGAAVGAAVPLLVADLSDGHLSHNETFALIGAVVLAAAAAFGLTNADVDAGEEGSASTVALVVIAVVLVLAFFDVRGHLG